MYLAAAAILFTIFVANVVIGASGGTQYLGDVGEAVVLFGASLAFVVAILRREAAAKENDNS